MSIQTGNNSSKLQGGTPPVDEIRFTPVAKSWTVLILVGLLVLFLLHIAEVLPPFIWAAVTAYIFNGPVRRLNNRFGNKRWVWALTVYFTFLLVLIVALVLLIPALTREGKTLAAEAPKWKSSADDYLANNDTVQILGFTIASDTISTSLNNVIDRVQTLGQEVGPKLVTGTFRFLIDFLLYLITTFYLLLLGGRGFRRFIQSLPLRYRVEIGNLYSRANIVLNAYIRGQVLLVLIMSTASFIILTILGVRYSLILGIMTGVLELVPFVGPYLAISICSLVAYFQPHGNFGLSQVGLVIAAAVALFTLRQIEDYVVIPNIIGKIVELPALLVIFTTIAGAALLGPMGLLLGVPIVAVIRIIVGYLYYKLVDADRNKLFLEPTATPQELLGAIGQLPPKSRVLVIANHEQEFLRDPQVLEELKALSQQKFIDLAFYCGEDEKTSQAILEAGFPITTMDQEHFLGNAPKQA